MVRDFITLSIFYYALFFANLFNMEKEERRRVTAEQKKAEKWRSGEKMVKDIIFCFSSIKINTNLSILSVALSYSAREIMVEKWQSGNDAGLKNGEYILSIFVH